MSRVHLFVTYRFWARVFVIDCWAHVCERPKNSTVAQTWGMVQELKVLAPWAEPPQTPWVGVLPHGLVLIFAPKMAHFLTLTWYWALQCVHGG